MKFLVKPVLFLSAIGLLLSLVAHVAALMGIDLNLGPSIFALHLGIVVVWFPTVAMVMAMNRRAGASSRMFNMMRWSQILSGCPRWMIYVCYGLFAYVLVNFFLFMGKIPEGGSAGVSPSSPEVVRGFSGHWLIFYYMAFAIAYSVLMKPELLSGAVCEKGHKIAGDAKFCSECGCPIVARQKT